MHEIGAHVFDAEPIGRVTKMSAELRDRIEVGLLCRRRQIADRHVLDHPPAQRAHLGHLKLLSERGLRTPHPLRQEDLHSIPPLTRPFPIPPR